MEIYDKLLLAILKNIPRENEKLLLSDLQKELISIDIGQDTKQYNFLFDSNLLDVYETSFIPMGPIINDFGDLTENGPIQFKVKTSNNLKYVYLTDLGYSLLLILQAEYIREQFQKLSSEAT